MRSDCSRRLKSARRRSASASSSSQWPTPDGGLFNDGQTAETFQARKARIAAKGYNGNGVGGSLGVIAGKWAAPTAADAGEKVTLTSGQHRCLLREAALWSSPSVADVEGGRTSRSGDRQDEPLLNTQARAAASPSSLRALTIEALGPPSWRARLTVLRLYRTLTPPRRLTWRRLRAWARRATRPKLSAAFVEWLMGWPPGWTACACSATAWSRFKARMRSELSALPWPEDQPAQLSFFG